MSNPLIFNTKISTVFIPSIFHNNNNNNHFAIFIFKPIKMIVCDFAIYKTVIEKKKKQF
jgi:hypothetical protein